MAQKLLKHELVERLLKLKEKQDELTVQMQCLSQEINTLTQSYMSNGVLDYYEIGHSNITQKFRLDVFWGDH